MNEMQVRNKMKNDSSYVFLKPRLTWIDIEVITRPRKLSET